MLYVSKPFFFLIHWSPEKIREREWSSPEFKIWLSAQNC